jgi:hypothetical protein
MREGLQATSAPSPDIERLRASQADNIGYRRLDLLLGSREEGCGTPGELDAELRRG